MNGRRIVIFLSVFSFFCMVCQFYCQKKAPDSEAAPMAPPATAPSVYAKPFDQKYGEKVFDSAIPPPLTEDSLYKEEMLQRNSKSAAYMEADPSRNARIFERQEMLRQKKAAQAQEKQRLRDEWKKKGE
ncbi:MAG: hypothetical protein JW795_02590 [Chitinivibrionales bacterium]|nr:hypothetical protein [Chitinivibrionales bacterium]